MPRLWCLGRPTPSDDLDQAPAAGLLAAIDAAKASPDVDRDRIALWGSSMSGSHVFHIAAYRDDVAAVIAMTPFTSGIAACKEYGLDEELVNFSGSGCSLGHPVAASGARMVTTLVYELQRSGGGQGGAVIVEV